MRVGVLGPLSIEVGGRPVEVGGARLRALLARLALEPGRFVTVERLVEALWPDGPGPGDPANAVQSLVSRLRKALGNPPELESGPRGYRLDVDPSAVDAVRFERLVAEGRRALRADDRAGATRLLGEALALWRGPALAELGPGAADALTARWAELRLGAVEDLVEASGYGLALPGAVFSEPGSFSGTGLPSGVGSSFGVGSSSGLGLSSEPDLSSRVGLPSGLGSAAEPGPPSELGSVSEPGFSSGAGSDGGGRAAVIAWLRELIAAHPLRERLVALLVRALHADGRPAEALAAFEACRARLAEQLGADPSPELRDAHVAVLRAGARPARVGNLRAALTSFVGRTGEVERLAAQVADCRLVTLVGPGGAGKTRLATTVARDLARQLPDGAWLVELAPVADAAEIPVTVLRTLVAGGLVQPEAARRPRRGDIVDQLAESLAVPGVLLLLDNCEHLVDAAAALIEELLGRCPKLRVLATSREPLGILGETLFPVGPLPLPVTVSPAVSGPAPVSSSVAVGPVSPAVAVSSPAALGSDSSMVGASARAVSSAGGAAPPASGPGSSAAEPAVVGAAMASPAVQLLCDRAAAVRPGFAVTAANVTAVVEICRRLDGLPLAIELAAARLRSFTPEQVAARLDDRFRLLTGGSRTALPRHRTLHAVVAWSWDLLGPAERTFAEAVAVFPGTFDAEAAAAVSAAAARPGGDAVVSAAAGPGGDAVVSAVVRPGGDAAESAVVRPGGDAAESAAGRRPGPELDPEELLHTLVDRSLLQVVPGGGAPRYRMLETIREFALEELGRRGTADAVRAAHARYFLELMERAEPHLRTAAQLDWLERLRPEQDNVHAAVGYLCDARDVASAFRLGAASGWFWTFEDNHAESALWLRRILAAGERDPGAVPADRRLVVRSMHLVNSGFAGDFQFERAELDELIAEALAVPPGGHPVVELIAPVVSMFRDDTEHGTALVRERLAGPIDPWARGMLHSVLGHLRENDGDVDGMREELTAAAAAFREIGERWGLAMTLASLADAHTRRGDFAVAVAHFEESIALHRRLGIRSSEAYLLVSRAALLRHTEGPQAARLLLREFVEDVGQAARDVSHAMLELGHLARLEGDLGEAERLYQEAWRLQQESPLVAPQYKAIIITARAEVDLARGEPGLARTRLAEAMRLALGVRDMPVIGKVAIGVAGLALAYDDPQRAAVALGAAQRLAGARDASNADWTARLAAVRARLGEEAFGPALARGLHLPRAEALAAVDPESVPPPDRRPPDAETACPPVTA